MPPTKEQETILDAVQNGTRNLTVSAVAGSGKTTTIVHATRLAGSGVGFAAFNSHIVDELRERLGSTSDAVTLHSLGFRILRSHRPSIYLDKDKVRTKLKTLFPQHHREGSKQWKGRYFLKDEYASLGDVVNICRQQYEFPTGDGVKTIRDACYRQNVDLPPHKDDQEEIWELANEATREVMDDTTTCDYADQLAMPLHHGWVRPQYQTLFIDEAQDLSPVQHLLGLGSGERIVGVGDPFQSIMGFAGADINSFPNMIQRLSETARGNTTLPLSCCFRCPASHLEVAQILVPGIMPKPNTEAGIIDNATSVTMVETATAGDMVLCRNTAPLIELAFRFMREGRPVIVRGRSLGDGLKSIVRKLRAKTITQLIDSLSRWKAQQVENLESGDGSNEDAIQRVLDQAGSLAVLAYESKTVEELDQKIDMLFGDGSSKELICLSTIHKAKGLEAERVWVYEPGLMPSRPGLQQELNLLYVALTRSKRELYFVDGSVKRKERSILAWVESVSDGFSRWELTEDTKSKKVGLFNE